LKGRHPKLNSHCWNDIKLAAGKNPDFAFWKTSMKGGRGTPLSEKIIVCWSMSIKQPTMSPSFHLGNWG